MRVNSEMLRDAAREFEAQYRVRVELSLALGGGDLDLSSDEFEGLLGRFAECLNRALLKEYERRLWAKIPCTAWAADAEDL